MLTVRCSVTLKCGDTQFDFPLTHGVQRGFGGHQWLFRQVYEYMMYQSNTTEWSFTFFYYLGQHVSILTESSSGPSKIQILVKGPKMIL